MIVKIKLGYNEKIYVEHPDKSISIILPKTDGTFRIEPFKRWRYEL